MTSLPPAKLHMLFPAHLWVRRFWPQIYYLWHALDWGLLSKKLPWKWVGPRMLKGQLSGVPWPCREFLEAVQFPACLSSVSAAPQIFLLTAASYSHSTSTSLHSVCFMCSLALERATSHLNVTRPLAYSSCHHGKMSTTLINSTCDVIMNYPEEKLCNFADSKFSTLISHPNWFHVSQILWV